jgi:hypothetical protein
MCNQERDVTLMLDKMQVNKELAYDKSKSTLARFLMKFLFALTLVMILVFIWPTIVDIK